MPFTGKIEEIWVQHNSEHQTIYEAGWAGPRVVQVPEGASWELHVLTTAEWPGVGPWSEAVSIRGPEFGGAKIRRHELAGGGGEFAWNIPDRMPARNVNLGTVKYWASMAYRFEVPPEEEW